MMQMVFQIPSNHIQTNNPILTIPKTIKKNISIKYDMFTKVSNPIKCLNCG